MKKLLITTLCISAFALTACDKKTEDSKATAAPVVSLSTNNNADIKSDLAALETLADTKAQEAMKAQEKFMTEVKTDEKGAVTNMLKEMTTFVDGYNSSLDALKLKSTEADAARKKMKELNTLTVQLGEAGMAEKPNQTVITQLTKNANDLQVQLQADMQALKAKAAEVK